MNKSIQLQGPFEANKELIDKTIYSNIRKIGIFSKPNRMIDINNMSFEIGKTGMLEIEGTDISSLKFEQDEDENTQINFIMS